MKLPLLMGIHCHQPVGNFTHVVDEAVENCYAPFMETALKYKRFKFSVHYSGWLLEFIRERHGKTFEIMQELAGRGQAEFFTGGYYEPVLASIPSRDRRGQIEMLSEYIEKYFNQKPTGLWLTERVWDSSIIPDAAELGIENVIVDDYHFLSAGYYKEMLNGYYVTEQDGYRVNLFPIDKNLRYYIPFYDETKVVDYLEDVQGSGGKCSVIFDDGEKFGVWPDTYEWVYEKKWLEKFIKAVNKSDKVAFARYDETVEKEKPAGLAYLPVTSYYEMGEWSLFAERTIQMEELAADVKDTEHKDYADVFIKGGIWKNFLAKYPESNRIHKRALRLSRYAADYNDDELTDSLYRAQCNDVLWHGIFGGLYLPNLRNNSWRFIIEGERRLEELAGTSFPAIEQEDMEYNGYDDLYIRNRDFNAMFTSRDCGQLCALEIKKHGINLLNTLTRRKEAYHERFVPEKDEGDKKESDGDGISTIHDLDIEVSEEMQAHLSYDWYNRNSFIDHFTPSLSLGDFKCCSFNEVGDFANQPADVKTSAKGVSFERKGGLYLGDKSYSAKIKKRFTFKENRIDFEIDFTSDSPEEITYFAEFNFHFMDLNNTLINGENCGEGLEADFSDSVIKDAATPVSLRLSVPGSDKGYAFTVKTVSQSEKGADLTSQGIAIAVPMRFTGSFKMKGSLVIDIS
ncbi:alpha-amylase/4-alpha-glucanotransferase domain-containing protein [Limisalsivibrio acetivorans]|uniref:alpha-amylase/4-alpha-glucanotransferase domain-containing protein n=1 Tax=Limisalsivibrio acetivorans TaxID=1304888 RepID=UPI0003B5A6F2|nr:alpha-amylase/4-alpha-glucanotransferase domain-containing protein [Limisalsivibrio acetivorans]